MVDINNKIDYKGFIDKEGNKIMLENIIGKTIENVSYNEDVDNEYVIIYFTDGTEIKLDTTAYDYGDKSAFLFS